MSIKYKENALTDESYYKLRESVGGSSHSEEQARKVISNSYYDLVVYADDQPMGMARVTGDGLYFLIADVIVEPSFQGNGYGRMMIEKMIDYIEKEALPGSRVSIQLLSENGKEPFSESNWVLGVFHMNIVVLE